MKKLYNFCKIPTKTISKTILKIHQWVIGFKLSKNIPIYVYEKKLIIIESGGWGQDLMFHVTIDLYHM